MVHACKDDKKNQGCQWNNALYDVCYDMVFMCDDITGKMKMISMLL